MTWTTIDHDPELLDDSNSDSDGLAFDHDAATTERRKKMDTLNSFLQSSPERLNSGDHDASQPAGKRKRGDSFSSSGVLDSGRNATQDSPRYALLLTAKDTLAHFYPHPVIFQRRNGGRS